jgi:hypothetical protein
MNRRLVEALLAIYCVAVATYLLSGCADEISHAMRGGERVYKHGDGRRVTVDCPEGTHVIAAGCDCGDVPVLAGVPDFENEKGVCVCGRTGDGYQMVWASCVSQ